MADTPAGGAEVLEPSAVEHPQDPPPQAPATEIPEVEIPAEPTAELAAADTPVDVVPYDPRQAGAIIRAEDPEEIIEKAVRIGNAIKKLIDAQGLSVNLGGKKPHVEVGGWQAVGVLLGALGGLPLHAETVHTRPVRNEDGAYRVTRYTAEILKFEKGTTRAQRRAGERVYQQTTYEVEGLDWEARVEIRTAAGVVVGSAEAMCSRSEAKWATSDEYSVRSMAETRAESRAWRRAAGWLVNIAGYSATPAEEMGGGEAQETPPGPAFGPAVPEEHKPHVMVAIRGLLDVGPAAEGNLEETARAVAKSITGKADGYMPAILAKGLVEVWNARANRLEAVALKAAQDAQTEAPDEPAPDELAALPDLEGPAPGSLEDTPENRAAYCRCPNPDAPLGPDSGHDDNCPIHGIGF